MRKRMATITAHKIINNDKQTYRKLTKYSLVKDCECLVAS